MGIHRRRVSRRGLLRGVTGAATLAGLGAIAVTSAGSSGSATFGVVASGGVVADPAGGNDVLANATGNGAPAALVQVPAAEISIQLYTVRDQLAADLEGTLAAIRNIGYTRVEHAGFVDRTAPEFRAALDAADLRATSGHVSIPQPFDANAWETALADATVLGSAYVVHPYFGTDPAGQPIRRAAAYESFARDLNEAGRLAQRAGLRFGYHNHQNEFLRMTDDDRTGFDILMEQTDPDLVHLELDLFWTWRAAVDPVDLIQRFAGRIPQVHVKDLGTDGGFADPGAGLIDFGRIFREAAGTGLVEYIVERDDAGTGDRTPSDALSTAQAGYTFLTNLTF